MQVKHNDLQTFSLETRENAVLLEKIQFCGKPKYFTTCKIENRVSREPQQGVEKQF